MVSIVAACSSIEADNSSVDAAVSSVTEKMFSINPMASPYWNPWKLNSRLIFLWPL